MAAGFRAATADLATPIPDEELVRQALAWGPCSFRVPVARYQHRLVSFLHGMVRDVDTAHDLAQEVFFRGYQALDRYDPQFKFSTSTFRVAHNLGIDELRRRKVRWVP